MLGHSVCVEVLCAGRMEVCAEIMPFVHRVCDVDGCVYVFRCVECV